MKPSWEGWELHRLRRTVWHLALTLVGVLVLIVCASATARADTTNSTPTVPITSGSVARWGNYFGGPNAIKKTPSGVSGLANVVAIDASNSSNFALECSGGLSACPSGGVVMAWGDGGFGQLGDGLRANSQHTAHQVRFPSGVHIVSIGEARNEGFAIDSSGQGWGWGNNGHGSLCIGNSTPQLLPVKIASLTNVTMVQGGQDHVLWLKADGTVVACGAGGNGQLGTGKRKSSSVPTAVVHLSNVVQITAGNTSSGARDASGNVYMWGYSTEGQTGTGLIGSVSKPTKVKLPFPAISLSAGGDITGNGHTFAILSDHSLYGWGDDDDGQLGDGKTMNELSPIEINVLPGVPLTSVVAGGVDSLALDTHGNVYAWGGGKEGQLGAGNVKQSFKPIMVDSGVDMISATAYNSLDHHS